ncbi:glycosyltransferase involved in cell wall biosynthesis [Natranaerovirga pectinivora]|uniref:Glycosyltransferase involved in cell wall biosynthesis n=1 Tax=Natranaerovirga pectinivora TaxID=682400 RepID=A0A4R3MN71_9FIRM|nr:glycosyltransferase [Natranaerovirga pectinivora]TCT15484.1 glycosyltransferase involved in cell wall biosynthesis [Natranaerovirga pectinivora]
MNKSVSLCMIVKNEEKNLPRCLESVKDIVDEMIIVDTGSEDQTIEIAKAFGAKVYNFKWENDFGTARNESIKYANSDWILLMDADDEFPKEDKEKFRYLVNKGDEEIYFFETHSYVGRRPGPNITVNLNVRLIKNNAGYFFESPIHEQLKNNKYPKNNIPGTIENIKIYHHGYLKHNIEKKKKRERNKMILKELIKKEPDNMFHLFNLGNEFFAENNYIEALEYYNKAYSKFDATKVYSPKLIIRMVLCCYFLDLNDEGFELAKKILRNHYPELTDLEYLKGIIFHKQKRYTLAIDCFNKCIEMREAPPHLKFILGVENYRTYNTLSEIYIELKDYDRAYKNCIKTLIFRPDFMAPIYNLVKILKSKGMAIEDIVKTVEPYFSNLNEQYIMIGKVFYKERFYKVALEYINKYDRNKIEGWLLKANCLLRLGQYEKCLEFIDGRFVNSIDLFRIKILALILLRKKKEVYDYINDLNNSSHIEDFFDALKVYRQFANIIFEEPIEVISEEINNRKYTRIVFEILEVLLENEAFDLFESALQILNLIGDIGVLLELGKLYHKYGYYELANKEIIRSIKEFEVFDSEGLEILRSR